MTIRGVLFDIGDTLLDATTLQRRALRETVHRLAAEIGLIDSEAFISAYQEADREPHFDELPDLNHLYSDPRIIARAFQRLSWPATPDIIARFLQVYRDTLRAMIQPDPDLTAVLDTLQSQGLKLGIVSNGTTTEQLDQLARMGIQAYFHPILISQDVGVRKPDPKIFLLVRDQWQLSPADILVVGDRGDWEVVGAHRAGMKSALTIQFVDHRETILPESQPDFLIRSLTELPNMIDYYNKSRRKDKSPNRLINPLS